MIAAEERHWLDAVGAGWSGVSRTSRSGKVSFRRAMERCARPLGLKASSPVRVLSSSGVWQGHRRGMGGGGGGGDVSS